MINKGIFNDVGVFKVFSARTTRGNYYVQQMPDPNSYGTIFRLMHDRRAVQCQDFKDESKAIAALLEHLRRVLCSPYLFDPVKSDPKNGVTCITSEGKFYILCLTNPVNDETFFRLTGEHESLPCLDYDTIEEARSALIDYLRRHDIKVLCVSDKLSKLTNN